MKVEIFTICDAASICGGKLCVIGSFDSLSSRAFPVSHSFFFVAVKLRFAEAGSHSIRIDLLDPNGKVSLSSEQERFEVQRNESYSYLWRRDTIKLATPGEYNVSLIIDSESTFSIPLHAKLVGSN